eukprot:GHVR01058348.1.p1 GENE.GHVR01058348.1~~GHVR01058348.1.p1  ORF type:complete len:338 (-),score=124.92 GHVR01058348.1:362-1375(-)
MGLSSSEVLYRYGTIDLVGQFTNVLPWPMSNRDCCVMVFGCDDLENTMRVIVRMIDYTNTLLGHTEPVPASPPNSVKMNVSGGLTVEYLGPRCVFAKMIFQVDMHVSLPTFFINYVTKNFAVVGWDQFKRQCLKVSGEVYSAERDSKLNTIVTNELGRCPTGLLSIAAIEQFEDIQLGKKETTRSVPSSVCVQGHDKKKQKKIKKNNNTGGENSSKNEKKNEKNEAEKHKKKEEALLTERMYKERRMANPPFYNLIQDRIDHLKLNNISKIDIKHTHTHTHTHIHTHTDVHTHTDLHTDINKHTHTHTHTPTHTDTDTHTHKVFDDDKKTPERRRGQ